SLNTAVATIDGNVVAIVGAGTAKIVARQAGDAQYNPADEVQQTLIVSKATQTITFNALPDKRLSDETFILPATASSGLPVSYVSSHPDIASIDGNRIILHKAGKIAIAANQAGNENYEPAMQVPQILNILKNLQSIAFAELPSKMFGEAPFTLSATASSSLPVVYESSNAAVATVVNNTVTLQGAGTTVITATQSGNDTFEAASSVQQTLVVELITDLEGRAEVLVGVYPNPVHDALSVSVASVGPVRIEMFDAMGRVVARETASSGEDAALQVDHLQPGIYHVKISTAHQVVTRQIIKK
ncbi:T9SS type A sorting domain-containing protein, partial [Fulvivirgaceae bacterium PWU4]